MALEAHGAGWELPPLLDQHCHGVARRPLSRSGFEHFLTEADAPPAPGTSYFDTQLGFAVRRWCAPVLDLEPHCPPARYLERRTELGPREVTRRMLASCGITEFLVDTGLAGDLTSPSELAYLATAPSAGGGQAARAREIVRLESLAEGAADATDSPEEFLTRLQDEIDLAARTAAGFKSVAAYRHGLDLPPEPPTPAELGCAAFRWLDRRPPGGRLRDPFLLRHLWWSAVRTGLPLQLHTGFGDPDLRLHRSDPLLLTDFVRAVAPTGCPLVLLHGYPYHRGAAYLAAVYPHVYADLGLTLSHAAARAGAVLGELLELVPFGKLLFSTDAYGLPELYLVGARAFGQALAELLGDWVTGNAWSPADADRVAALICAENARRIYG
ncbi:amidohydrolase family protein [Streptomyces sp. NPDC006879]|uniref:amidohydrolase family protein n=1 Tax=Streptomyces sp. NPDC006879 TaxID=3364767 RepID=UPI0036747CA6